MAATYYTYDIGCSTDVSLHWKHYDWLRVFDFFRNHPRAKATFATKYVNEAMLHYDPQGKIRIRFSLMPEPMSLLLEPRTTPVEQRIAAISRFAEAGYDVHLNFSPIVFYEGWLDDYRRLFGQVDAAVPEALRPTIAAECIFATHNAWQHQRNVENGHCASEEVLWQPDLQEWKRSQYGSSAVRYKRRLKEQLIADWTRVHDEVIPWNAVRYMF